LSTISGRVAQGKRAVDKLDRESKLDKQSKAVIGVDIGGTNIKIVMVDPSQQQVLERLRIKTLVERGPDTVLTDLSACLIELTHQAEQKGFHLVAVGVGCAGLIDLPNRVVVRSPNLPGWVNVPLGQRLSENLQVPVLVENDVNCISYGEYWLGGGRDLGDFLCIAPGTGVGGCLMVNGKAWQGEGYSAGEIGHMTIQPDGEQCRCGNHGCLETLASASWLVWRAEQWLRQGVKSSLDKDLESPGGLDAEIIYRAAMAGDQMAQELFKLVGTSLAIAIANVVHLLGIQAVLIAGGMANGWEAFIDPLQAELERRLTMMPPTDIRVVKAQLGDEAGALGGGYLAGRKASLTMGV
jgi:glucokinase